MFQLDTHIPLSSQGPQSRSPLQTIGALGQLQAQQELGQQRRLINEQRQRALDDDEAIRTTLPKHARPDDAIEDLYSQGRASAAAALSKNVFEFRKSQAEAVKTDLDNRKAKFKMASQIARGAIIDGTENGWQSSRPAIAALVGEDLSKNLPTMYDKKAIEGALAWGDEYDSYLDGNLKATDAALKAIELQHAPEVDELKRGDLKRKANDEWVKSASNAFGTVKPGDESAYEKNASVLLGAGMPPAVLELFGKFDEGFADRARKLGMTSSEEVSAENSAAIRKQAEATAKETKSYHDATLEQRRLDREQRAAGTGGSGSKGLTPNAVSDLKVRKNRAYTEAEKAYATAVENLRDSTTGQVREKATPEEKQEYEAVTREHGQRKLQIEDAFRDEMGMPPILATELSIRNDKTKAADLRKIRNEYKMLTGNETPLEQLTKVNAELAKEKDPEKRKALFAKGEALMSAYAAYRR